MQYFLGEQSNGAKKLTEDAYPRGIGRCFGTRPIGPCTNEPWFLDNGVFPAWNRPDENGDTRTPGRSFSAEYAHFESRFSRVSKLVAEGRGPEFMVIPDRPAEASSLYVSLSWLFDYIENQQEEMDPLGWYYGSSAAQMPLYLAVQDGMTASELEEMTDQYLEEPILNHVSGIFIGGSDPFKKETMAGWRSLCDRWNLKLHYGRCTQTKLQIAKDAGCDSADSSHPLRLGPDRWARFLGVYDKVIGRQVKEIAAPKFTPWPSWVTGEKEIA